MDKQIMIQNAVKKCSENLGRNVKHYRELRGLSQKELIKNSGISKSTIAAIERGEANLSMEMLAKLSVALNVSIPLLITNHTSDNVRTSDTPITSVANLYELVLYMPLLDPTLLAEQVRRVSGDIGPSRHDYIDDLLTHLVESIKPIPALDYVQHHIAGEQMDYEEFRAEHAAYMRELSLYVERMNFIKKYLGVFEGLFDTRELEFIRDSIISK